MLYFMFQVLWSSLISANARFLLKLEIKHLLQFWVFVKASHNGFVEGGFGSGSKNLDMATNGLGWPLIPKLMLFTRIWPWDRFYTQIPHVRFHFWPLFQANANNKSTSKKSLILVKNATYFYLNGQILTKWTQKCQLFWSHNFFSNF